MSRKAKKIYIVRCLISLISREADRLPNIPDFVYRAKRKKEITKRKERKIERKERMKKRRAHFCYSDKKYVHLKRP